MESAQSFISRTEFGRVLAISWSLPLQFCGTRPLVKKGRILAAAGLTEAEKPNKYGSGMFRCSSNGVASCDKSPQELPVQRETRLRGVTASLIAGSGRIGGEEVVAYPRLGASVALGIDPDIL